VTDAEYAAALVALIDTAALSAGAESGRLTCDVSFAELAALMGAAGPERLRFARGGGATLWTSVGYVHLQPRPERPAGPFEVTAT
jgi:hypothetical protein